MNSPAPITQDAGLTIPTPDTVTPAIAHRFLSTDLDTVTPAERHGLITAPVADIPEPALPWVIAFRYLRSKRNQHTRAAYTRDLSAWLGDPAVAADPFNVTRATADAYAEHLERTGRSPATVARVISAIHGFYRYAAADDIATTQPFANVERPEVSKDSQTLGLDRAEAGRLLKAARGHSQRAASLVTLLMYDGLRVSEVVNADVTDQAVKRGHKVLTVTRKGGARRDIAMNPATAHALEAYIGDRTDGPLFLDNTGKRLTRQGAGSLLRTVAKRAELEHASKITPHSLRHTFVTLSREAGVSLEDVQDAAGHADPRTTRRYDRARHNLDRHPAYALAAFLADSDDTDEDR